MLIFESAGMEDKIAALRHAIENHFTVAFYYVGKKVKDPTNTQYTKSNWRRVEPFALGKTKDGDWLLRAYQYNGVTNTKNEVYKTFRVDEITSEVKLVYDRDGKTVRSFEPRTYVDDRGEIAAFRSNGSDLGMKGGVDSFYDVDAEFLAGEPKTTYTAGQVKPLEPTAIPKAPAEPAPAPTPAPTKNKPQDKTLQKKVPKPGKPVSKPTVAKPEPKVKPAPQQDVHDEEKLDNQDDEWQELKEGTGFLKWLSNLNYGSR